MERSGEAGGRGLNMVWTNTMDGRGMRRNGGTSKSYERDKKDWSC